MSKADTSCYATWVQSKTGTFLPCYKDGKPSASIYNPEKEASSFAALDVFSQAGFILVAGIGAALHLNELAKRRPDARIAAVEANEESLRFVLSDPRVKLDDRIAVCTADGLYDFLLERYFPPADGNFCLFPLRSWAQANPLVFERIKESADKALSDIGADVSTQARFGKLWHANIMRNLFLYASASAHLLADFTRTAFPTEKTAFVAGAGPGLENAFDDLKRHRDSYYIVATDTAFAALSAQGIASDAVVTIDPQLLSIDHFYAPIDAKTLFICDLCCCSAVVQRVLQNGARILFFKSAHPLCSLIELLHAPEKNAEPLFPFFDCSSGTVTLTALDFAVKAGFKRIVTGGADFCYTDGKTYVKGSYFDQLFGTQSSRLAPAEQKFCALMYRNELESVCCAAGGQKAFTTPLLKQYKEAFDRFCALHAGTVEFIHASEVPTKIKLVPPHTQQSDLHGDSSFAGTDTGAVKLASSAPDRRRFTLKDYKNFLLRYENELQSLQPHNKTHNAHGGIRATGDALQKSILPYAAWYALHYDKHPDLHKIAEEIHHIQKKYLYNTALS